MPEHCPHSWIVTGRSLKVQSLTVDCCMCGATGVVPTLTPFERHDAMQAERNYVWPQSKSSRVLDDDLAAKYFRKARRIA